MTYVCLVSCIVKKRLEEDARGGTTVDEPNRVSRDRVKTCRHDWADVHVTQTDQSASVSHHDVFCHVTSVYAPHYGTKLTSIVIIY